MIYLRITRRGYKNERKSLPFAVYRKRHALTLYVNTAVPIDLVSKQGLRKEGKNILKQFR